MANEEKKIIKLQILDEVLSLSVSEREEERVRHAAKILNDRAHDLKKCNPSLTTSAILSILALDEQMSETARHDSKEEGRIKRMIRSLKKKCEDLFILE